jgi:hypothetical protein
MRKTILIPTDFTITPLLLLKHAAVNANEELDVIFLHSTLLSDSITDLLFYSPRKILDAAITKEFREGCSVMQNKYTTQIKTIGFEIFSGKNAEAFRNLAEANRVDEVWVAQNYSLQRNRNVIDPVPLIIKSGVPLREIDLGLSELIPEKDLLSEILVSSV